METSVKIVNQQVNNPQNYSAIYARISGPHDNNSINAQLEMAKDRLNEKGLLVYASYADCVSAKSTPPHKRKAFKKLLEDAKAGCFKNLIIYRLDRLVRGFKDWLEIKKTLSDLGVNLLFSDPSQELPADSPQTAFLQNLTVMIAELEPSNIYHRASNGRKFRRKEGAYSAGRTIPFGYIRIPAPNINSQKIAKSFYQVNPIKIAFVQYIFANFKQQIESETISILKLRKTCSDFLDMLLNALNENTILSLKDSDILDNHQYKLLYCIYSELKEKDSKTILAELSETKKHFFTSKTSLKNTVHILKNPVYAGYMLDLQDDGDDELKQNKDTLSSLGLKIDSLGNPYVDFDRFINIKNLTSVIDSDTFQKVYCHLIYSDFLKIDKTPEFLLKGRIKCACGTKLLLTSDGLLHCEKPKCAAYIKTEVIELILSTILDNALNKSDNGFTNFSKLLTKKIEKSQNAVNNLRSAKIDLMKNYITHKSSHYLEDVYELTKNLASEIKLCCEYRRQLSSVNQMHELISSYYNNSYVNQTTPATIKSIKDEIINYILANEFAFSPLLNQLIKDVKVVLINGDRKRQIKLQIKYQFTPKRDSDIFKSIQ